MILSLTPLQRAGGAYVSAGLWGQSNVLSPTEADFPGLGYVSAPVGPTSDLVAYGLLLQDLKMLGKRVHVSQHHDGQPGYEYWPYRQPDQFVAFSAQVGAIAARWLDSEDTYEVTNEPNADPSLGSTWAQQLPLYRPALPAGSPATSTEGTLCRARDAVRAAGVKAMMLCPIPGSQDPQEAVNVVQAGELPLAWFEGWDGISGHFYAESPIAAIPGPGAGQLFAEWAADFQTLADAVKLPWVATEYGWGNNTPSGPRALFVMRSLIEVYAAAGTCLGGIVWQLRTYDPTTSIGGNTAALAAVGAIPTPPAVAPST